MAYGEVVAGVLLWVGWQTRAVSLTMFPILVGAAIVKAPNGWVFTSPNGGWEYPAYLAVLAIAQALLGAGAFSVDRARA